MSSGRTEFRFTPSSLRARAGAGGQGEADRSSPKGKRAVGEVGWRVAGSCRGVGRLSWRRATARLPHPVSPQVAADLDQLATWPPPADRRSFPPPPPIPLPIPSPPAPCARVRVVRALPTRGPMQRVVACTVTMCDDVNVYYLDQWRSSDSSTDINITIYSFREGHMTLLTHALHRAPSVSLETWSGELQYLFDRAVTRRCWTQHATTIVNNDIAREDAVRFRHETAARWCARC